MLLDSILTPILALICWSLIIWGIMYLRRIPAMQKAGINPQEAQHTGSLNILPSAARAAAENYNHLMEQPTLFYVLAFYTHLVGATDQLAIILAWTYVVIRILHSIVQITVNIVVVRFSLFVLSTVSLIVLAAKNVLILFA